MRHGLTRFMSLLPGPRLLILCAFVVASVWFILAKSVQTESSRLIIGLALPQGIKELEFVNGTYETFAREVEARTSVKASIIYAGALGSPVARLNQVRRGVIQMSDASDANYATVYKDILVLNLPYLFPDKKTAHEVLDGPVGDLFAGRIREKTGIKVLGWWESGGFRHFSSNTPITVPGDMQGLKMRVLGPLTRIMVESLGASAVSVSFSELYTSLSTGVVDGQDNSLPVFNSTRLYEVQSNLTTTAHSYAFAPLGINNAFFEQLPEQDQRALQAAADVAVAFNRRVSGELEAQALAITYEHGVNVNVLDSATRQAFARRVQPPAIKWLSDVIEDSSLIKMSLAAVANASGSQP
ncbi:MAG: tripartite ATP-independent transporter DctP family solute receptor [Halioglobus sp.]|jgi:tripartite ATP-independent transporter DctP family solute receptor